GEDGCPIDSDGDGVPDFLDKCPGTPKGATIDARGCWVIRDLQFDFDKYYIKPDFEHLIAEVADVLKQNPGIRVRVDGHTDSAGSHTHNQKLSGNRAKSVRQALVAQGIPGNRIESQGFGEGLPIAPNTSPENMYLNRRVEITVLQ
ncbi:MAG: OmpA family protein, partial [Nitrospinae bacterium]|nr:OmpA family protein [Nitrospinota bacterium]